MDAWNVDFYKTAQGDSPVELFIKSLSAKDQVKVIRTIGLLKKCGTTLKMPHSRPIVSENNLFELRTQLANNIYRVFYFYFSDRTFVLLHGFTKKSQKTPKKEIQMAKNRKIDYIRQQEIRTGGA